MYNNFKASIRSRTLRDSDDGDEAIPRRVSKTRSELSSYEFGHVTEQLSPLPSNKSSVLRSRSQDRKDDPLGLEVVYSPPGQRTADIIFVHGLGGTSRLSWSYGRNLANFWPKEWLPDEPGFTDSRILTFGYNANFMTSTKDIFNISVFAKDLLFQLKTAVDQTSQPLGIGEVPIIFVVHSMGGLVVKKAYILGSQDVQFKDLIGTVRSIVFLATPHRGSNLAEILNKFLTVTFQSPKQYVAELQKSSPQLSDINDQFRLHADKLDLVSFFETLPTTVGVKKMIVVERESAVIGYGNEISASLVADHHTVNKFPNRRDKNYTSVRNAVKTLIDKFKLQRPRRRRSIESESITSVVSTDELMNRLGVERQPTEVLEALMDQYEFGTCDWILDNPTFASFVDDEKLRPSVLHITGGPGTGKSVMASFIIQHLQTKGLPTQFWYFRHDNQVYRSNRQCLLSLAFQVLESLPEHAQKLIFKSTADIKSIARSDLRSLWQKLILSQLQVPVSESPLPCYWVIDALDESESAQAFLGLMSSLASVRFPLRLIVLTRSHTVTKYFDRLRMALSTSQTSHMVFETPKQSLEMYISGMLVEAPWEDEQWKQQVADELLQKSQGSFLWLYLVIRDLINCDTTDQVMETLRDTPAELSSIYERMEQLVVRELRKGDAPLIKAIFSWVACSERQLHEDELKQALKPKFSVLNLRHTIGRLCGDFVTISRSGYISMVHYTAKEYLTKYASTSSLLYIDTATANALIFDKCLETITDARFRIQLKSHGCTGLLRYCCLLWPRHLVRSKPSGDLAWSYTHRLANLFRSPTILAWIESVATTGKVTSLVAASQALASFVSTMKILASAENPMTRPPMDDVDYLDVWSTELVRIVGKFGTHLLEFPYVIYSQVPLFCPLESVMHRQFSPPSAPLVAHITGLGNSGWDDTLARFALGQHQKPQEIYCLESTFGLLTSDKCVNLYDATTFQELRCFKHGEIVAKACFSKQGDMLVTCGIRTVKVWHTSSGDLMHCFSNPHSSGRRGLRAMVVAFSRDESEILMFCMDSSIQRRRLFDGDDGAGDDWVRIERQQVAESVGQAGGRGSPTCLAFSPDGSMIVLGYRVAQMSVWDTETGFCVGRCESKDGYQVAGSDNTGHPTRLVWNPVKDHVVGLTLNGSVFKWDPMERHADEMDHAVQATEIACSADGRLFVTAHRDGSLKVFSFDNFSLLFHLSSIARPTALAFSSDGRRIYDLRQYLCSVWEPNALIRVAEQDDEHGSNSDAASSSSVPSQWHSKSVAASSTASSLVSEATAVILEPITAVATNPSNSSVAYGNNGGAVTYVDWEESFSNSGSQERKREMLPCGFMDVRCLSFSHDGRRLVAASIDCQIVVQNTGLWAQPEDGYELKPALKLEVSSPVLQIILDATGEVLLVHMTDETQLWNVSSGTKIASTLHNREPCHWMPHPSDPGAFLLVKPLSMSYHQFSPEKTYESSEVFDGGVCWDMDYLKLDLVDWTCVAPMASKRQFPGIADAESNEIFIHKALPTPDNSQILLHMSGPGTSANRRESRFVLLDMSNLSLHSPNSDSATSDLGENKALQLHPLPAAVLDTIEFPLGFMTERPNQQMKRGSVEGNINSRQGSVGGGRFMLAFLDRDLFVRTWSLDDTTGHGCKRHFFLPRDWVNLEYLNLATVTADGRFVCPRNGEMAVVHNGLWGTLGSN